MPLPNPHHHHAPETGAERDILTESPPPLPLFIARVPASTRPLSAYERFFCLMEHVTPLRFVFVAQISGLTTPCEWRQALDRVQSRHPLLSVAVEEGADGIPRFRREARAPIPLHVALGDPHQDWTEYASAQLATPFDSSQAPLVRATLILGEEGAAFLLAAHPAVADGLSLVYVLRDILDTMCG
ncbi:MAG TPA: condensation domain-containing protein, partial [Candidatus Methylacidiphilales bacterium]|nr:condensation domain-containing protein [Candidatus Methylacidiphilales bacterium]